LFQLRVRRQSSDWKVADSSGVGGLHQVVSELILKFMCIHQTKEKIREVGIVYDIKEILSLLKVTQWSDAAKETQSEHGDGKRNEATSNEIGCHGDSAMKSTRCR